MYSYSRVELVLLISNYTNTLEIPLFQDWYQILKYYNYIETGRELNITDQISIANKYLINVNDGK